VSITRKFEKVRTTIKEADRHVSFREAVQHFGLRCDRLEDHDRFDLLIQSIDQNLPKCASPHEVPTASGATGLAEQEEDPLSDHWKPASMCGTPGCYLQDHHPEPCTPDVTTGKRRRDPSSTSSLPPFLASTPRRRVTTTTTRTHQHHNTDSGWRGDALAHEHLLPSLLTSLLTLVADIWFDSPLLSLSASPLVCSSSMLVAQRGTIGPPLRAPTRTTTRATSLILVGSILPGKAKSIELDVSPVILFRSTAGHVHLKCSVKRRDAT
jgi:hypothetical protein